jgi:two-component system response regulator VicR
MAKPLALVVEDDKDLSLLFCEMLHEAGYETETAFDGQQAIESLGGLTPHVVLLDMNLPKVSGVDVLKHIRSTPRLANANVMVATANPQMARTIATEADLVLIKPVSFHQLLALARRLHPDS